MTVSAPATQHSCEQAEMARLFGGVRQAFAGKVTAVGVIALMYGAYLGWLTGLIWFGAYAAAQAAILRLEPKNGRLTPLQQRFAPLAVFLSSAAFGSITLITPLKYGAWGVTSGGWILSGGMAYVALTYIGSRRLFRAALAPLVLLVPALVFESWMLGARPADSIGLFLSGLAGVAMTSVMWRTNTRIRRGESQARAEAERGRLEAERAVAARSAFIAVVSHELRTPISAILAGSSDLQRSLNGSDAGKARLISDAGAMMRTLLNDLLDKAKIDAGKLAVDAAPFNMRALVADQMMFWRAEARRKGLRLKLSGASDLPAWVVGDPIRIRQILNNLFSNALKFTTRGEVRLQIEADAADGAARLRLIVQDTGPGMSAEASSRLFRAFEQTEVAHGAGGTGLGLAISRDLARTMGGDITVESAPGAGSSFTLHLVLPLTSAPASPEVAVDAELPSLKVLVVDDHEINRKAMGLILEPLGVELSAACSGLEALALLECEPFDLVLMDCLMPGMDGLQTTRELRATPGPNRDTPVIAVTGAADADQAAACLAAGMNSHVSKPIDPAELIAAMIRLQDPEDAPSSAVVALAG